MAAETTPLAIRILDTIAFHYRATTTKYGESNFLVTITALALGAIYKSEILAFSILSSYWYPKLNAQYQINSKIYDFLVEVITRVHNEDLHVEYFFNKEK